ncbi:UNVERIFIED_CONTAM: pyridoxamine 5'-phosphate oxidase [Mumia flava]
MSSDEATVKPWSQARTCLESAPKVWLATTRPEGRAHVMPILIVWVGDAPCFATRPVSRKGRNLATDGRCVITVSGEDLDLVVEGLATRVTADDDLTEVAAAFLDKYAWEFAVRDGVVRDGPLLDAPEYAFFRLVPTRAFGYGADGLTATRWRFAQPAAPTRTTA